MTTYSAPDRTYDAGVPAQWADDFSVTAEGVIVGEYPAQFVEDKPTAYNQTLLAYTVVGFNESGEVVKATNLVSPAAPAIGVLTFSGVGTANDTITIGAVTYTLVADPTTTANEVEIGATAAETATNLIAAINAEAGAGTIYGSATVVHPTVVARSNGAGVVGLVAKTPGATGNAIATTEAGTGTSFAAATLTGGVAQIGAKAAGVLMYPVTTGGSGDKLVARVLRSACVNPDRLVWDASFDTDAKKYAAFEGSPSPTQFVLRKLAHYTPVAS